MTEVGNLLGKIIDSRTIIIRVVGLMAECLRISKISLFLERPPRILSGFTWSFFKKTTN